MKLFFQEIRLLTKPASAHTIKTMSGTAALLPIIILFAFIINLPLGYLRRNCEKFSFGWYFYVHISIPAIVYMRVKAGFSWKFIPLTLLGAVAGQYLGGRLYGRGKKSD